MRRRLPPELIRASGGMCAAVVATAALGDFRVGPYLQNPTADAVTIRWLSETAESGTLAIDGRVFPSTPVPATALDYQAAEPETHRHTGLPYLHSVRVSGLAAANGFGYTVVQGTSSRTGSVHTPPSADAATAGIATGSGVRLFVFADAETEPESRSSKASWVAPSGVTRPAWVGGVYPATQTEGYSRNLQIVAGRAADATTAGRAALVALTGDLVESGGEQRDWDEFWRHAAGPFGDFAANVAIAPALGNHENYGGPGALGGYSAEAAAAATAKYATYFEMPSNGAARADHRGRYHRVDFGPVALITLDSSNGGTQATGSDTNFQLDNAANPQIPDYAPGSEQYRWLEAQLTDARAAGRIVFVQYHHAAYSSGPHGWPAGTGPGFDGQSGSPMRALTPLLASFGVRAVFSGHDEMYEHSIIDGIHFFDVGIAGDGLRGPEAGLVNPYRQFLAHDDAPEVWAENVLVSGGKHYGHLEIDVALDASGAWQTTITPAYAFPLLSASAPGEIVGWERRTYDDVVTFTAVPEPTSGLAAAACVVLLAASGVLRTVRRRRPTIQPGATRMRLNQTAAVAAAILPLTVGDVSVAQPAIPSLGRPQDAEAFRVTVLADGLSFPTGITPLEDGSLLVATSDPGPGGSLWSSASGRLLRVSTDPSAPGRTEVAAGLPGLLTGLSRSGSHVFALASQPGAQSITVLRGGEAATDPLQAVGALQFVFPPAWEHTVFTVAAHPSDTPGAIDVHFNVGAKGNAESTPETLLVGLTSTGGIDLASATLLGDSIYRVTLQPVESGFVGSQPMRIASGLRNAAGMAFDGAGNFYFQDNGIDTPDDRHVSLSADTLHRIAAADLGSITPDFGFAETYVRYTDGVVVDPDPSVRPPLVAFRPVGGERSEGATGIALAPASFGPDFAQGMFTAFFGTGGGGIDNEENPVVFSDLTTGSYFHFIPNQQLGHPYGLAAADALFLTDMSWTGSLSGTDPQGVEAASAGVIYRIAPVPEAATGLAGAMTAVIAAVPWMRRRDGGPRRRRRARSNPVGMSPHAAECFPSRSRNARPRMVRERIVEPSTVCREPS